MILLPERILQNPKVVIRNKGCDREIKYVGGVRAIVVTSSTKSGIESKCGFNNLIVKSAKDKLLKSIVRDAKKMGQTLRFVWC